MNIGNMTYQQVSRPVSPSTAIDLILNQLESEVNTNTEAVHSHLLRSQSRDLTILDVFSREQFIRLLSIFMKLTSTDNQFDLIVSMSNVMLINKTISTFSPEIYQSLRSIIPHLYKILDTIISERKITSEDEYSAYLPIFRFYFLLLNYSRDSLEFLTDLRSSIQKITSKLLNFVAMSSLKSNNLNLIIIEILKILYSYIHLSIASSQSSKNSPDSDIVGSTFLDGIDSSFVLSCNKFNLLYTKTIPRKSSTSSSSSSNSEDSTATTATDHTRIESPSRSSSTSSTTSTVSNISIVSANSSLSASDTLSDELIFNTYDDILFHFGNVMLVIPTCISKNYMLNKVKFTENIIYYLNKYFVNFTLNKESVDEDDMISRITSNLLTMDVLLAIDEESEIRTLIRGNLSVKDFQSVICEKSPKFDNLKIVITELNNKLQQSQSDEAFLKGALDDISQLPNLQTTRTLQFDSNGNNASTGTLTSGPLSESDLQKEAPNDEELDEINELFDKIEKNGIFKITMK